MNAVPYAEIFLLLKMLNQPGLNLDPGADMEQGVLLNVWGRSRSPFPALQGVPFERPASLAVDRLKKWISKLASFR